MCNNMSAFHGCYLTQISLGFYLYKRNPRLIHLHVVLNCQHFVIARNLFFSKFVACKLLFLGGSDFIRCSCKDFERVSIWLRHRCSWMYFRLLLCRGRPKICMSKLHIGQGIQTRSAATTCASLNKCCHGYCIYLFWLSIIFIDSSAKCLSNFPSLRSKLTLNV
jgi:hypothetical protein